MSWKNWKKKKKRFLKLNFKLILFVSLKSFMIWFKQSYIVVKINYWITDYANWTIWELEFVFLK